MLVCSLSRGGLSAGLLRQVSGGPAFWFVCREVSTRVSVSPTEAGRVWGRTAGHHGLVTKLSLNVLPDALPRSPAPPHSLSLSAGRAVAARGLLVSSAHSHLPPFRLSPVPSASISLTRFSVLFACKSFASSPSCFGRFFHFVPLYRDLDGKSKCICKIHHLKPEVFFFPVL